MMKQSLIMTCVLLLLTACGGGGGGSSSSAPAPTPVEPSPVAISGVVLDGPVSGGTLFVFSLEEIEQAITDADAAEDRLASLNAATSIASQSLGESEDGSYQIELDAAQADNPVFIVFDGTGAQDLTFGDTPFNMMSVAVLGGEGSDNRINVTPQTTMVAAQVQTDMPADAAAVASAVQTATTNVIAAIGRDEIGNELLTQGSDLVTLSDEDVLIAAASSLGAFVRSSAVAVGITRDEVLLTLSYDALDGDIDGNVPASAGADAALAANAAAIDALQSLGGADGSEVSFGSCSGTANLFRRSCEIDIMDDYFEGIALCQDGPEGELSACAEDSLVERSETLEECGEIFEARLELCELVDDAVYEPAFGSNFADNFVDPRDIGHSVAPNPYFPLVQGNVWVYESTFEDDGEEVTETTTVTVKSGIKLIEDIACLIVNDVVEEDGEVIEDTDDWFAQDVEGNVWYCGEISMDFEYFEGDMPETAELVSIGGSWKAGREGAKAGILVPANPTVGEVLRNEVLYGEAEDVAEVLSVTGDESGGTYDCDGACLVLREFTPLEPDTEEASYYKPGVGVIVKLDLESEERAELQSFTNMPAALQMSAAKLLIEHNATDEDTGFQGFGDGDPWDAFTISDADDNDIVTVTALGGLMGFGLTELFFETSEPENAEVPIDEVTDRLPEGDYLFETDLAERAESATLTTPFSHDIPQGPQLLTPADEAEGVDPANTVITWEGVEADIDGDDIEIVGYQVIVEQNTAAYDTDGFAKPSMSVYLGADARSLTVPVAFMVDDACYEYEILAIEETGNQTLASAAFETGDGCEEAEDEDPEGLKAARILIEHNATDEDTGFQGFADGDPWNSLTITDSGGVDIVSAQAGSGLLDFGLTEFFFETNEPENAEVSIDEVLSRLPEGTYTFTGDIVDAEQSTLTATFTHAIPMGPVLLTPVDGDEEVDAGNTVVSWQPVSTDLDGQPVTIVAYQVIVEKDVESSFPDTFAESEFNVFVPPSVNSITIPVEFMESGEEYGYEVLAIEDSGNQTLAGAEFETE